MKRLHFSKDDVEKILNFKGSYELSFIDSVCQYEDYAEDVIKNATEETELQNYLDWIKGKKIRIIVEAQDFTQVYGAGRATNYSKLFRQSSRINTNLVLSYPWFFFFFACWYKNQHCEGKGGIGYTNRDIHNVDLKKYYDGKNFIHKDFEVKKGKRYIFRISVEVGGQFEILHDDEFIENLIFLVSHSRPNLNKTHFNDKHESIHFVYLSDEFCRSEEVVILSMQFFNT